MTHDDKHATAAAGPVFTEGLGPLPERESVDDALLIVESYGPWGADLNDAHRRQIVLADEVKRLRADALRFRWLAERTAATGLERWVHPFQFLAEAVDERMKAGATSCD